MARVVGARAVVLRDLPERPDEADAGGEHAEHAPVAHDEQQHQRRADKKQRGDDEDRHHAGVAAFRKAGGEADGALRRGRKAAVQRADESAIGRRAVVIDLAGGPGVGDGERAPVAKTDQASVDDILAVGAGRHVDGSDIGPELPPRFPRIVAPDDRGVPPGIEQRHAMVRIAPKEALAVLQVIKVIGRRGRGRRGIGHAGRLADFGGDGSRLGDKRTYQPDRTKMLQAQASKSFEMLRSFLDN